MWRVFICFLGIVFLQASCAKETSRNLSFELVPYLEDADLFWNTHFMDFGKPAAQPYLDSSMYFYSLSSSEKQMMVRCRTTGAPGDDAVLVPVLNGYRLKPRKLRSEFREYSYGLAPYLLAGKNRIQFLVRSRNDEAQNLEIDYIAFDQSGFPANHDSGRLEKMEQTTRGITAPVPSVIQSYLRIPQNARLDSHYGLVPDFSPRGSSAEFAVYVEDRRGARKKISSRVLTRGLFFSGSASQFISLDAYQNQIVRITLEVAAVAGRKAPRQVFWQDLRIMFPPSANTSRETAPVAQQWFTKPNIFFYLMDALRWDHLETYGYSKPTSPRIKEFSNKAVVFENAYAQSSWTRASVSSIVTSLYPTVHKTVDRVDVLDDSLITLQAILKAAGYHNYGLIAQPNVGSIFHFEKNFEVYKLVKRGKARLGHSDQLYEQIQMTLNKNFAEPAFVYIHAIDTHRPYIPLPQFLSAFGNCREEIRSETDPEPDMDCVRAVYDSLILQSDYYFGLFLGFLQERKLLDDSIIILTADHGESFMEHGILGHGKSLYETDIRVPLIIRFPQNRFSGTRVRNLVRHIDLLPTLLEILSVQQPAGIEGSSLLPLLKGIDTRERPVFSELALDGQNVKSLILGNYKLIATAGDEAIHYELYDLASDPDETKDILNQEPVLFGYMRRVQNEWLRAQQKKAASRKSGKAVLDTETEEMLKGLGYLQ